MSPGSKGDNSVRNSGQAKTGLFAEHPEIPDHRMNGRNNTDCVTCDGIRLICAPNPDYRTEITNALNAHADYFPYDYYHTFFLKKITTPYFPR